MAPTTRKPAVMQLNLPHQGPGSAEDDTIAILQFSAGDFGNNSIEKRPRLNDFTRHALRAYRQLDRLEIPAERIGFNKPDWRHHCLNSGRPAHRPTRFRRSSMA